MDGSLPITRRSASAVIAHPSRRLISMDATPEQSKVPDRVLPVTRVATSADVPALLALEARYYVGNLPPDMRANGFISIQHSAEWFAAAVAATGIHVAELAGNLVGFIAVTAPPGREQTAPSSITRAMLDLTEVTSFHGRPLSRQRVAWRGPVLIAEAARGLGIYTAFNAVTREAYRDRFDVGVLFVAADNPRSLHTTTAKLGAESLAVFDVSGRSYHFLAYAF